MQKNVANEQSVAITGIYKNSLTGGGGWVHTRLFKSKCGKCGEVWPENVGNCSKQSHRGWWERLLCKIEWDLKIMWQMLKKSWQLPNKTCQMTNQQMCQMRKVCKMGWKWPKQSHMATRGANQYRWVQQTNGGRPSKGLHSFGCAVVVKLGDDGIAQLWAGSKMLQTQVSIWANCAKTCYFEKCESPLLPRE